MIDCELVYDEEPGLLFFHLSLTPFKQYLGCQNVYKYSWESDIFFSCRDIVYFHSDDCCFISAAYKFSPVSDEVRIFSSLILQTVD